MSPEPNGRVKEARLPVASSKPRERDDWADGLRGISAVCVVTCHASQAFFPWLLQPSCGPIESPHLLQLPFLRIFFTHGRCVVAIFFVLMGYVNSLKPIKQARAGDSDGARTTLARGTFNRTGRLVFPAAIITTLTWFFCQLGFMDLATKSDSHWMRATGAPKSSTLGQALIDLPYELIDTWFFMNNKYDQPQWTLSPLLHGSLYVFGTLFMTIDMKPLFRLGTEVALWIYFYLNRDCLNGVNVFAGMIMAELSFMVSATTPFPGAPSRIKELLRTVLPFTTAIFGLYLCSFPDRDFTYTSWSWQLALLGQKVFPHDSDIIGFWPAIGAQIFCFSVYFSPLMRRALSHPFLLYLGTISFPLYLLHGPLMRSVLTWLAFGPTWLRWNPTPPAEGQPSQGIPSPNPLALIVILPTFWTFLAMVVHNWTAKVEPRLGKATKKFEDFACQWGKEKDTLPAPTAQKTKENIAND